MDQQRITWFHASLVLIGIARATSNLGTLHASSSWTEPVGMLDHRKDNESDYGKLNDLETFVLGCVGHYKLKAPKIFLPADYRIRPLLKRLSTTYFVSSLVAQNNVQLETFRGIIFGERVANQVIAVGSAAIIVTTFQQIMEARLLNRPSRVFLVCLDCATVEYLQLPGRDVLGSITVCHPQITSRSSSYQLVDLDYDYLLKSFVIIRSFKWTRDDGFADDGSKAKKRNSFDLKGAVLTALAAVENLPFIEKLNGSGGQPLIGGFAGELSEVLSKMMHFRLEITQSLNSAYGDSTTGLIAEFVAKEYDIGLGVFSMSPDRQRVVEFTKPICQASTTFVMQRPSKLLGTTWNLCTRPFAAGLWWAVLLLCVVSSAALALAVVWSRRAELLPSEWVSTVMSVWLMQGDDYFPATVSAKAVLTITSLFGWILLSIYNSFLVTFLALDTTPLLTNLQELSKSGMRVGVTNGVMALDMLKSSSDPNAATLAKRVSTSESHRRGLDRVCSDHRYAQLVSVPVASAYAAQTETQSASRPACQIYALREVFFVDEYHFVTQKSSVLAHRLSSGLTRLHESGILMRLAQKSHVKSSGATRAPDLQTWVTISVAHVAIPLGVLLGGVTLSFAILLAEIWCFRFNCCNRKLLPASLPDNRKPKPIIIDNSS